MRLTTDELAILTAACADRNNVKAQEVLNVLGTKLGPEIAVQISLLPSELQSQLEKHIREAIDEQKRRVRPR
jgi:hypothetical protein